MRVFPSTSSWMGSTIAPPPPNQRFSLTHVSWLFDTRKDAMEKKSFMSCSACKRLSNDDIGWQGAPSFRRYGWELVSKPAILLKKNRGAYRRTTPSLGHHCRFLLGVPYCGPHPALRSFRVVIFISQFDFLTRCPVL